MIEFIAQVISSIQNRKNYKDIKHRYGLPANASAIILQLIADVEQSYSERQLRRIEAKGVAYSHLSYQYPNGLHVAYCSSRHMSKLKPAAHKVGTYDYVTFSVTDQDDIESITVQYNKNSMLSRCRNHQTKALIPITSYFRWYR